LRTSPSSDIFLILPPSPPSPLFPTRRSSDLHARHLGAVAGHRVRIDHAAAAQGPRRVAVRRRRAARHAHARRGHARAPARRDQRDRKSTRLNSSHLVISYAVFCLKKKKKSLT